jgi:hypothetical protein
MGWWKHLWQLCEFFGVDYMKRSRFDIPLLQEDDKTIMDALCDLRIYSAAQWIWLNRVRKFKGVHTIGDMVLCDGRTLDPAMLTRGASDSDRIFPVEKPMPADFGLWSEALHALTHQSLKLQSLLGPFVSSPHRSDTWFTNDTRSELYKVQGEGIYDLYSPRSASRRSQFG